MAGQGVVVNSQDNPASKALTKLAAYNVTAGCWQGAGWTVPPVQPGGQTELAFFFKRRLGRPPVSYRKKKKIRGPLNKRKRLSKEESDKQLIKTSVVVILVIQSQI